MSTEQKKEDKSTTHWKTLLKNRFLGAHDFLPGQEFKIVIDQVKKEKIINTEGKEEEVPVMAIRGSSKPMILNKTNMKAIDKIMNSHYIQDWAGRSIVLYVAKVQSFGEWVDAIRIKAEKSITPEDLTTLFEAKKANLTPDDIKTAERIIGNKEVGSYGKLKKLLDSK